MQVEDGTLTEVTDRFLEMLQGGVAAQQQHCPFGVQHEYVTSREQWVRLRMDLLRKKVSRKVGECKSLPTYSNLGGALLWRLHCILLEINAAFRSL